MVVNPPNEQGHTSMQQIWSAALERLSGRLSPQNFDMWLRPIEFVGSNDGEVGSVIHVRAPNAYVRLWFESNFLDATISELRAVSGREMALVFEPEANAPPRPPSGPMAVVAPPSPTAHPDDETITSELPTTAPAHAPPPVAATVTPVAPTPVRDPATTNEPEFLPPEPAQLNPRYTFDTFVAGPSNQLAFAASQAAASTYPPKYNPVFICGGVGLGKTHLLHAIGHLQLSIRPGARIVYLSSERFMNEYVNAIRSGRMHEFRRRYREGIDVLLVDDVQFLAGKDGTQDEFFHTFNALHDGHKQIVLTADRKPHEISDIADRLRTRFAWGLLADIEPPELEVRIAILRKKAANENILLPDDVALYIASSIKSNVRELEGALIRLAAYASLSKRTIDLPFAQETLGGALTRPREHITVDTVIKAVASYYGVKPGDIKSPRRHKSVANPRAVAMYLARQHTKDSYPDLGRAFGGKHHTTVISAVEKILEKIKEDPGLRGEVHAIEAQLLK
jgi:chromosomal replication initiator protein